MQLSTLAITLSAAVSVVLAETTVVTQELGNVASETVVTQELGNVASETVVTEELGTATASASETVVTQDLGSVNSTGNSTVTVVEGAAGHVVVGAGAAFLAGAALLL